MTPNPTRGRDLRHQQSFFASRADDYADGFAIGIGFLQGIRDAVSPHIDGRAVLDVGNGGLIGFDAGRAASVTVADLSPASLVRIKTLEGGKIIDLDPAVHAEIRRVGADVMRLPFAPDSFDVVVMSYVAHHLSVRSRRGSRDNVRRAFAEVWRVLCPGGALVLLENCPTRIPMWIQAVGFPIAFRVLIRWGKPLPYFLTERRIADDLHRQGFALRGRDRIPWSRRVHSPLFPKIAPPGWLWERVLKNRVFLAVKEARQADA